MADPAPVARPSERASDVARARYLASLAGSWDALAAPHPDAHVVRGRGFLALRHPRHPVLTNVALLDAGAVDDALTAVAPGPFAAWSCDAAGDAALAGAGLRRDVPTVPMLARLDALPPAAGDVGARAVAPAVVARLNGVDPALLAGVPEVRAWTTAGGEAGLVLQPVDDDVVVSFVVTRPDARRRGLATALLTAALHGARADGATTATLQSTPDGRGLYERLGFAAVGRWQEWVPA
ncbi:GNAT family N-acetyltransferase [Cellulomonas sp. NPDC057328]|uniref:GNAT family N-acetyltransferase n=1 Tax=Cellulomonas sp. NPDC057328 TaxID=3346101 RepID=UPI00362BE4AF